MDRKTYLREYQKIWLRSRRDAWFKENGPCKTCGSWENLELDHIDPTLKVSNRIWSWNLTRRNEEISKCQVLCKKCHQDKTCKDFGWGKYAQCGTPTKYSWGCRCRVCTSAKVIEVNEYRWKTGRRIKRDSRVRDK